MDVYGVTSGGVEEGEEGGEEGAKEGAWVVVAGLEEGGNAAILQASVAMLRAASFAVGRVRGSSAVRAATAPAAEEPRAAQGRSPVQLHAKRLVRRTHSAVDVLRRPPQALGAVHEEGVPEAQPLPASPLATVPALGRPQAAAGAAHEEWVEEEVPSPTGSARSRLAAAAQRPPLAPPPPPRPALFASLQLRPMSARRSSFNLAWDASAARSCLDTHIQATPCAAGGGTRQATDAAALPFQRTNRRVPHPSLPPAPSPHLPSRCIQKAEILIP
jgi:hypothetical protein